MSKNVQPSKDICDIVSNAMAEYGIEVIKNRAIPDYRDGLKPVQRYIVWQAFESGLKPGSKHAKLAKLSGLVSGNYHPHGPSSVEGAAIILSQAWNMRMPLIDIHGNNGSVDGSSAAAARYVEARLAPGTSFMIDNLDKNPVEMVDNYDGTRREPVVMPALLPYGLINGAFGIALGMRCDVLPHNPVELVKIMSLIAQDAPKSKIEKIYGGPDFPTGNQIIVGDIKQDLWQADSSFTYRANMIIEDNNIIITEAPFGVTLDKLIESIATYLETHVTEATGISDESDSFPNVRVVLRFKRNVKRERLEEIMCELENKTLVKNTVSGNNLFIVDGKPCFVSVFEFLSLFNKHCLNIFANIRTSNLEKLSRQYDKTEAELQAVKFLPQLVKALEASSSVEMLIDEIVKNVKVSRSQAEYIAKLNVSQLLVKNDKNRAGLEKSLEDLSDRIARLNWEAEHEVEVFVEWCKQTVKTLSSLGYDKRLTTVGEPREKVKVKKIKPQVRCLQRFFAIDQVNNCVIALPNPNNNTSFETFTDRYVGIMLSDGEMVVRLVDEIPTGEPFYPMREVKGVPFDSTIVGLVDLDEAGSVYVLTDKGRGKRIPVETLKPQTNTRHYFNRAHVFAGLEGDDDSVMFVGQVVEPGGTPPTVEVTFDRKIKPVISFDLAGLSEFSDSCTSRGRVVYSTHKGRDKTVSVKVLKTMNVN